MLTLIPKNFKLEKLANFPICYNWRILKWSNIWKCSMLKIIEFLKFNNLDNLIKLLNILVVQIIYKK